MVEIPSLHGRFLRSFVAAPLTAATLHAMKTNVWRSLLVLALAGFTTAAHAAENRIDRIRPDAPELAAYGPHGVGVRTLEVVNPDEVDLVQTRPDQDDPPRYDRRLALEVWYPASPDVEPTPYSVFLRDGKTEIEVLGRAARDAEPDRAAAPYPLVLISHGYPGNRYLMSHLGENLASKGYVVASIDHTDSTYRTAAAFSSTLVNRPLDQLFVLEELARRGREGDFLRGLLDAQRTGLIGYSMGGYGAVITAGGGLTEGAVQEGAPLGLLEMHQAGSSAHAERFDERIRAVVAFAPWGMLRDVWDAKGLEGIRIPTLFVAGSDDRISGYEEGVREIFEHAVGVDRYLLTFEGASHNAAAPMPAPAESAGVNGARPSFDHYADPIWDTVRMNNIAQHFVTAYFGKMLKGDANMEPYLDPAADSGEGWTGFPGRTARGLRWEKREAQP